jgi:hypothetical protein
MNRTTARSLTLAGTLGFVLAATGAQALPVHMPGKKAKPVVAANEGSWIVKAGSSRDIYANLTKAAMPMQAYVCTQAPGPVAPKVELQVVGRTPIDIQGCQSVYLLVGSGERLAIINPNPADVTGSYKLDLQGDAQAKSH